MLGNDQTDGTPKEMLAFVINALNEHEKKIDRLINMLETVKDDHSNNFEKLFNEFEKIEEKIASLQNKIDALKTIFLQPQK